MKEAGVGLGGGIEKVVRTIQEELEAFKKKFDEKKMKASQEIMMAENPDELIEIGRRILKQGEALKKEQSVLSAEEEKNEAAIGAAESAEEVPPSSVDYSDEVSLTEAVAESQKNDSNRLEELRANGPEGEKMEAENFQDIYGMNLEELSEVLNTHGYGNEGDWRDIIEKITKPYEKARVALFDRVISGEASEEEIELAKAEAAYLAKTYGLRGFDGAIPKRWYTVPALVEAMAATSSENKTFIERIKKDYLSDANQTRHLYEGGWEEINPETGRKVTYSKR